MNSIMEECEASTDVLQSQVDEARERSQRELDELRRQLQEKGAELEKSRQAASKLQEEVRCWSPLAGLSFGSQLLKHMLGLDKRRENHLPPVLFLLLCVESNPWTWPGFTLLLVSVACSAASSGGASAEVSTGAAGGPAEVQTTGEEGGGAGGEGRVCSGGERAARQTPGGTCLSNASRFTHCCFVLR